MKKIFTAIMLLVCVFTLASCSESTSSQTEVKVNSSNFTVFSDEESGLYGYKDKDGNVVIDCQFDRAGEFNNDRALVWKNKRGGYIDPEGQIVVDFIYKEADDFSNGRALVRKDDKYGFIDTTGDAITDFVYDNATSFNAGGYATVIQDGRTFEIDKNGNEIIVDTASDDTTSSEE